MAYTMRRARLSDINALRRLELEIFPKDAYPKIELLLQLLLPRARNYVITVPEVVGFGACVDAWLPEHPAWIVTLGIGTAYQRRGWGAELLAYCEERLRADRVRLTVRASNTPAIYLYEKAGYHHLKRMVRYYNDGEDGLIMEKALREDL